MAETTGERLRRLRGNRSRAEVASDLGIAASTLAMYEYEQRRPKDDMKRKIAEYYGRSVAYIFFNTATHETCE